MRSAGEDLLVLDVRHQDFVETPASDVPDHPPNFERVKRANVGRESVPDGELADLELGPSTVRPSEP